MSSRRVLKAAEAIREVVSTAILTELRDPRISDVTVTYVELAADMRNLIGDRHGWGQFRAISHDLVYEHLTG